MGCDIHYTYEYKDHGKWIGIQQSEYHKVNIRNYRLFEAMAGVRGDTIPEVLPRVIPSDPSGTYSDLLKHWEGDGHSHSWLTEDELLRAAEKAEVENIEYDFEEFPSNEVRICFFFDN